MARKTLLSEGEIRQFMKLANLTPLGHGRLEEMGYGSDEEGALDEEEELEMDMEMGPEDAPADDMGGDEMPMDDEPAVDDMDDMRGAEGGAGMVSIEDFMSALESALEEITGEPVSTEMDDDLGGEEEVDMADEPEMDMDAAPEAEMGPEEEEEEVPGMRDGMYEGTEDDIVAEVARRVVGRLKSAQNKQQMVDNLAERILTRLTSK